MKHINRPLPFILASTNTGAMIVNHQDYAHDQHGNTYGVGYQYLSRGSFDPSEIELVLNLLNLRRQYHGDGVTALDCGANIGAHTIAWGIEMTGWGKVISFEAQERIYYALAGNIALNNCFNVRAPFMPHWGTPKYCPTRPHTSWIYPYPTTPKTHHSAAWNCARPNITSLSDKK